MTIYLTDLLGNPRLLDKLRGKSGPLTVDELEHDIPVAERHPMNPSRDNEFGVLGNLTKEHPIPTAGFRRG